MPQMAEQSKHITPITASPFWACIRITRPWNVLMVGISMTLIRMAWIKPGVSGLIETGFVIPLIIMMLLAASGNVINDYFDVQEDAINKPKRAFVGRIISRRKTLFFHHFLTGTALSMSAIMSLDERSLWPFAWTVIVATLLWGYSPWYKRRFLRGNAIIALLVGQLPFWTALGEIMHLETSSFFSSKDGVALIVYAFLSASLTFLREITKDLQDRKGDAQAGYDTLAVRWKESSTWRLLDWLHGFFWIPLLVTSFFAWYTFDVKGATLFFLLPFAGAHIQLIRRRLQSVSAWQKLTLSGGIVFLLWVYFS